MQDDAFVIVFPAEFARRHAILAANIRRALDSAGQKFDSVRRDGDIIAVHANDPVLASAAINRLFGIRRVAIARRSGPDLESLAATASRLGRNLLLKNERFLVVVRGAARGFMPADAEMAVTSRIIEEGAAQGIEPGSEARHDKKILVHITSQHAYTCIFVDEGLGGAPNSSRGQGTLCPVYDGVSAVSCIESARQGYDPRLIVAYRRPQLSRLARMIGRIIQFMPYPEMEIEFYLDTSRRQHHPYTVLHLCNAIAQSCNMDRISLPFASQIHGAGFVDHAALTAFRSGMLPNMPLEGREGEIRGLADRYMLGGFLGPMQKPRALDPRPPAPDISAMIKTRQQVTVRHGPNAVHDILDSLD